MLYDASLNLFQMAYSKKYPDLEYNNGVRGRHGVAFRSIAKWQKRFLLEHNNIRRFGKNEQALKILLGLYRSGNNSLKNKLFYDWTEGDMKLIDGVQETYDTLDWTCAISGKPIKSRMGEFEAKNFVHPEYWDTLCSSLPVNQSIVKSSLAFRQKCQELLLNEQKELMKLFKKNANPRKTLD